MGARNSFKKSRDGFYLRDMNAQAPTGKRATDTFQLVPTSDVEGTSVCIAATGSTWDGAIGIQEGGAGDDTRRDRSRQYNDHPRLRSLSSVERNISEQLSDLLRDLLKDQDVPDTQVEALVDAFEQAADVPPITKQSLSELDIHNIIGNIKLRHDVNFDRDTSFRPNNEGPKGHHKRRQSEKYWLALEAELHLYVRLFQGTPFVGSVDQAAYFKHAQRRIPKMFNTIHSVLKSLVPERDHQRVDEHLDVQMLMQKIERGICDMVKLAEWTARLLKEHCAPMRDDWVDEMVALMREGAANNRLDLIVQSLNRLLGMLETMKLDVANHQIRNFKPMLIEDTLNFEKHYHLDQIVHHRTKVSVDSAQEWWRSCVRETHQLSRFIARNPPRPQSEIFAQAVVCGLFSQNPRREFPETFYLDYERLRTMRREIEDLVYFEICFIMFDQLLKEFGYSGTVPSVTRSHLRAKLAAIKVEGSGLGQTAWTCNVEQLSLEIDRQARLIAGQHNDYSYNSMQNANERLQSLFATEYPALASKLENIVLKNVRGHINKHHNSSPAELYNSLVAAQSPPASMQSLIPSAAIVDQTEQSNNTPPERFTDLSKQISHIIILHWRIWAPIAYAQENTISPKPHLLHPSPQLPPPQPTPNGLAPPPLHSPPPPPAPTPPSMEHDVIVINPIKMGEPPDPSYDSSHPEDPSFP